jgi:hypothetical protein
MLILGSILLGTFIFYSVFFNDDIDDDGPPDDGIMQPVYQDINRQ